MTEIIRADNAILAKYIGGIIKQVSENGFRGHGVRWHDPNHKDLHGEWFSQKTYFMRNAGYPVIGIPVNYQHGLHKDFGNLAIGIVNFADEDEIGLLIEGEKKTREQYIEMLKEIGRKGDMKFSDTQLSRKAELAVKAVNTLIAEVPLQFSGGFDPSTWLVDPETKHIDQAGMIHLAFTPTPADDLNPIVRFKSAIDEVLKYEPTTIYSLPYQLSDSDGRKEPIEVKGASVTVNEAAQPHAQTNDNLLDHKGHKQMSLEEMLALLRQLEEAMTSFGQSAGASEADAVAMAEEVTDELGKADGMEEEELKALSGEKLAEKAFALFNAKLEKQRQNGNAAKAAFDKLAHNHLKAQPATQSLPAFSGGNGNAASNGHITPRIQVKSQYDHWNAEDFSFALSVSQMTQNSAHHVKFNADEKILREFADKATKAYNEGKISLTPGAIKSINAIKANELDHSTQSGYGDEWVFTAWADNVWDKPRLDNVVVPLIQSIEMPSNPYEYPVESTDPTVFATAETTAENQLSRADANSAIPDSKVATAKVQFNAKKQALRVTISAELEEDGIARLMPKFREQAQRAILDAHDRVALVGDTSTANNINLDGGTPTTQAYISYDGLVHQALVTATTNALDASAAAPTLAHIRTIRSYLGNAQGYNPANLAIITDFPTYMKLLSANEVMTVDKYGAQATVMTGELGKIDGIPVFVSNEMALADSDGKITDGGNVANRGRLLMFYRPDWFVGFRRRVTQHVTFLPYADAWELVMTVRHALTARSYSAAGAQQSTDDSVALLYNIGV